MEQEQSSTVRSDAPLGEREPPRTSSKFAAALRGIKTSAGSSSTINPIRNKWRSVVHRVLREKEERDADPFGEKLAAAINQHPAFRSSTRKLDVPDMYESFVYPPLISQHNVRTLVRVIQKMFQQRSPKPFLESLLHFDNRISNCLHGFEPSQLDSAAAACFFLMIISLLVLLGSNVAIIWTGQSLVGAISVAFLLTFDWNDIKKATPQWLTESLNSLSKIWEWFDSHVFQRRRFAGREWKDTDFLWGDLSHVPILLASRGQAKDSRSSSLWSLPPPSIKEGRRRCLDRKHMQREDWSRDTTSHIIGINYCYVMLREEHLARQARRRERISENSQSPTRQLDGFKIPSIRRTLQSRSESSYDMGSEATNEATSSVSMTLSTDRFEKSGLLSESFGSPGEGRRLRVETKRKSWEERFLPNLDTPLGPPSHRSEDSIASTDAAGDLPWIDVGAKIGMQLLHSVHVHRAVASQETTERLMSSSLELLDPLASDAIMTPPRSFPQMILPSLQVAGGSIAEPQSLQMPKPIHPLWTSPAAAVEYVDDDAVCNISALRQNPPDPLPTLVERHPETSLQGTLGRATLEPVSESAPRDFSLDSNYFQNRKFSAPSSTWQEARSESTTNLPEQLIVREPLSPGVKVAVPLFPNQPGMSTRSNKSISQLQYQMGTVVSSKRIFVGKRGSARSLKANGLSVTVKLDGSFLRNGEFADLTFRVLDCWGPKYMPKHSKVPVGACVATSFGVGILVGWRVEDDCHVVRSLWQRRGPGTGHAYLNRESVHGVVEAAIGFKVNTSFGLGHVLAYVDGGPRFDSGRFFVALSEEGQSKGHVLELNRGDILSCQGAQFIPVIEHIREAAHFQIQVDSYKEARREKDTVEHESLHSSESFWKTWSVWADILWESFLKAVDEDKDVVSIHNEFMSSVIKFLERLDGDEVESEEDLKDDISDTVVSTDFEVETIMKGQEFSKENLKNIDQGLWIIDDIFGGVFSTKNDPPDPSPEPRSSKAEYDRDGYYDRIFAIIHTLMKTVSIARVASTDHPHLRLALAIFYDLLLFVRKFVKVQKKNVSIKSMEIWKRAIDEIASTFGPINERLGRIAEGIAFRMEKQGRRAKTRVLKLVDTLIGDEKLLIALEQGDWDTCAFRLEAALVKAKIIDFENISYYRKAADFLYGHGKLAMSSSGGAAARNSEKLALLAQVLQWIAAPRRSVLKLFERNDVLEFFERILVRVFHKEELASRMLLIHASNFHSLRHLRRLKDFSTASRLWMPVLDAADEEFAWLVAHLPEQTKDLMSPMSKLFSLCVAHFHQIDDGSMSKDWMDFLFEEDAVRIIHDIDTRLILALESFSRDIKDMMLVLPYYSSIDDDILHLMDEVNLDEFLREASEAMEDNERLNQFVREKATIAIERFLNYLPRMSIPVEKRDLMEGWVLTCRGEDGKNLTLSDVKVRRDNLVCQILGGDALFFPMFGEETNEMIEVPSSIQPRAATTEESILDHIRELILQAQKHGCWKQGTGGVVHPPTDRYVASVLNNLPVTIVLNCAIELWRNLEIDDDELLEIAIRDVSFQIQLHKDKEDKPDAPSRQESVGTSSATNSSSYAERFAMDLQSSSFECSRKRFNPRIDPTVFFLEMRNLTLNLESFLFRIEKNEKRTILDPVFDGKGSLAIHNVSIRVRVDCAKERLRKTALGETFTPVLVLRELSTSLERVHLQVKDTGFGSDWIVNKAVDAFEDEITKAVEESLREQIMEQARATIENMNSYFLVNPTMLLELLGISMDDLDNHVVWV